MSLVDAQVREAIRAQLTFLQQDWERGDLPFERSPDGHGFLWRSRGEASGLELVAAFFVTEREEYAKAWYDALLELTA